MELQIVVGSIIFIILGGGERETATRGLRREAVDRLLRIAGQAAELGEASLV